MEINISGDEYLKSLPKEFKDRMKKLLGDEWENFEYSYMKESCRGLRINSLKKGVLKEKHGEILKKAGIDYVEKVEWADGEHAAGKTSFARGRALLYTGAQRNVSRRAFKTGAGRFCTGFMRSSGREINAACIIYGAGGTSYIK